MYITIKEYNQLKEYYMQFVSKLSSFPVRSPILSPGPDDEQMDCTQVTETESLSCSFNRTQGELSLETGFL
jgi:hypothetical protein